MSRCESRDDEGQRCCRDGMAEVAPSRGWHQAPWDACEAHALEARAEGAAVTFYERRRCGCYGCRLLGEGTCGAFTCSECDEDGFEPLEHLDVDDDGRAYRPCAGCAS